MNKSFLKWAGGKRKSAPMIVEAIGQVEGRYIEPFIGGGTVAFNVDAYEYFLSDINPDLITTYRQLRSLGNYFVDACSLLFEECLLTEDYFYKRRSEFNDFSISKFKRALLFVYLNRTAFNGLCRYNKSGKFNVPYGHYKQVYFPEKEMRSFVRKSKRYVFKECSFVKAFDKAERGDVIYCDPPYTPLSKTASFTGYSKDGFGDEDHKLLVKLALNSPAKVLISNHDIEHTRELYKDADDILTIAVSRSVSGNAGSRKKVDELLAIFN